MDTKQFKIWMPEDIHHRLKGMAYHKRSTMTEIVLDVVNEALAKYERENNIQPKERR